jgi:hypothetical protein
MGVAGQRPIAAEAGCETDVARDCGAFISAARHSNSALFTDQLANPSMDRLSVIARGL